LDEDAYLSDRIKCLVCNEEFKKIKTFKMVLNAAKKRFEDTNTLYCDNHKNEPILYICKIN
jgi:hypothetical protein